MTAYTSTDGIKTPGGDVLTDVLGGGTAVEDWHVVGDPGEPAFVDATEAGAGVLAAFGGVRFYTDRERVFIVGVAAAGAGDVVFVLPEALWPTYTETELGGRSFNDAASALGACSFIVDTSGQVAVLSADEANVEIRYQFRP